MMTERTESARWVSRKTTSATQEPHPPMVVANNGLADLADRTGERLGTPINVADVADAADAADVGEVGDMGTTSDVPLIVDISLLLGEATPAERQAPREPHAPREVIGHWRPLEQLQAAAQRRASEHAPSDYQARLADNSRRAHWGDLKVFAQYVLTAMGGGARPSTMPSSVVSTTTANATPVAVVEEAVEAIAPSAADPLGSLNQRHLQPHLQPPADTLDEPAPGLLAAPGTRGRRRRSPMQPDATRCSPMQPDAALVTAYATHLLHDPTAWADLRYGVVVGFVRWQLAAGYAIQSINRRLSTVKTFAQIAVQAGALAEEHAWVIATVAGIGRTEGRHLDAQRPATRRGRKKAQPVAIPLELARRLKYDHPATPQGRRDALIMCLLLDHGLRCGEVVELQVEDFALEGGPTDARLRFYRRKVDLVQTHRLTVDTYLALVSYLTSDRVSLGAAPPAPSSDDHPEEDADEEGDPASDAASCATREGGKGAEGDADDASHRDTAAAAEEPATVDVFDTADAAHASRAGAGPTAQPLGDEVAQGPLLCGSPRGGRLTHVGMRANALSARVRALGTQMAVNGRSPPATLSPHDCRHYWATMAFRAGADIKAVQDAGGWSSAAMPMLYALAGEIANEGIVLPR